MKKILAIMLLMVLCFTGCTTEKVATEKEEISDKKEVTEKKQDGEVTTKKTEVKKVVEISWLVFETPGFTAEMYASIIDLFEKDNPDIKIKKELYPTGDRTAHVKALYATQQMPDIILGGTDDLRGINALVEVESDMAALLDPAVIHAFGGKLYEMPTTMQIKPNMYYNKALFEANNLEVPKTWDEFVNVCEVLKSSGVSPIVGGGPDKPWLTGVIAAGPMLTQELNAYSSDYAKQLKAGDLKWDSEQFMDIVTRWDGLQQAGYFHEGSMSFTYAQHVDEFFKGNAAMICNGSWMAKQADGTELDFDIGWFPVPGKIQHDFYSVDFGNSLAISVDSKHIEESKRFVKAFFENEDIYRSFIQADGAMSTTKERVMYEMGNTQKALFDISSSMTPVLEITKLKGEEQLPPGFVGFIQKSLQNVFVGSPIDKEVSSWETKYRELLNN